MAQRPQATQSKAITAAADTIIKAKPGILYSLNLSWSGASVGDLIHIVDAATADVTGTKIFTFRAPAATGTFPAVLPAVGLAAEKGIFLNCQTGGLWSISVGFD